MAVPQLQLANLGEIYAQNQAKQAAMDTMQLEQASAVEKMRQEQLARQKQSQLMDLARTVDISKPEGAKQAFELGLMDLPTYTGVQKSATDMALAQQRTKTAQIQGQSSLMTAKAAERRVDAQVNRYRTQNRIDQAQLDIDRQNTEREYGLELTETFINTSVNILSLPPEEQEDSYNAVQPLIENMTGEKLPEWKNGGQNTVKAFAALRKPQAPLSNVAKIEEDFRRGRLSQQQRDAAIANATTTKGTRTTINPSTGAVVIEEGGMAAGGAQPFIGVSPQQSSVLQDIEEVQAIASGEKGPVAKFFATGAPSITGKLGAFTPGGYTGRKLDTIVSNLTLDKLQQIRKESPTGAALGNASDKDIALLKSSAGTLNQSQTQEDFLRNLAIVKDQYKDTVSGTPSQIVSAALSGKVNVFDAADAIKRDKPQNYMLSVPSLAVVQNLPPVLQSAMSGMQVRDQQTGQTITINAPAPANGGQGGNLVRINNDQDWQALPSGTQYVAPDGQVRVKK